MVANSNSNRTSNRLWHCANTGMEKEMIYDFKIHAKDRNRSSIGMVEAYDILEATRTAVTEYKKQNPNLEIVHITIEDSVIMPKRREQWEKEQTK